MIGRSRIPYQSCVVLLYEGDLLSPFYVESPYQELLAASHLLRLEEPLIQDALTRRKPRFQSEAPPSTIERIFKNEASAMAVPLLVSKESLGVIYLGSKKEGTHTAEHLRKLKTLCELASPSIKNARLFEDKDRDLVNEQEARAAVEAKNLQLSGLQQLGQKMGNSLRSLDTITVVARSLREMVPAAQSVIFFTCTGRHSLKAEFADTPYAAYVGNLALRDDEGLLGKAASLRQTVLVRDTELFGVDNILASERSVVVAPLLSTKNESEPSVLLGMLYVGSDKQNAFDDEHRDLIETVSYQAAIALKNARLYEQTQQLALTDGLTGLCTHRLFQERLSEELERGTRLGQPVVLAMVDADNFKTYNDTLGHPAGDALLRDIAHLLKEKVRSRDIVCRYGGDEFALLLVDTSKEEALVVCERVREAFQLRFGSSKVQVTSSIGLACFPTDATSKKDLAQAADDALYQSKRSGRNRVSASRTLSEKTRPLVYEVLPR